MPTGTPLIRICLALTIVTLAVGSLASATAAMQNSDCFDCHSDNTSTKTNAAGQVISLFVDQARYTNSVHRTNACLSCHTDIQDRHPEDERIPARVNCAACHERQSETYGASAHAAALKAGKASAATCVDCHGVHDILRPTSPESPLHFTRLTATCGECHPEVAEEVAESVHGKSAATGHREAATCIDCHSEHRIEDLRTESPIMAAEKTCSQCHASERINTKFRMPADRVSTYMGSYHGLASKFGSTRAANCASCHGVHLILRSTDPRSSIHPTNLVATCGKCHPGATENFASSRIHTDASTATDLGSQVNYWVRRVYLGLIYGTVGLMLAHNFLVWRRKALASLHSPDRIVLRMDQAQRWQHLLLAVSFLVLAVTGFALKFPDSWLAHLMGSDEAFRRVSHRVAGVVMLVLGLAHVLYVIRSREGRRLFLDLLPRKKDLQDLAARGAYLLFHRKPRPKIARFGYVEKLEYWAVVWGTLLMGATGLMIWFKMDVTRFLPRWAVDVAMTAHYYEAILACLAIVVWHFYHVILDPDTAPMNWAWWDGKVSEKWYRHEHPLDESALGGAAESKPKSAEGEGKSDPSGQLPSG